MSSDSKGKTKKIIGTIVLTLFFILAISYKWYIFAGILVFLAIMLWNGKENVKDDDDDIEWRKERQANKNARKFKDLQIKRIIMQLMESHYILRTTKNIETFKSRYDFFIKRVNEAIPIKDGWKFKELFKEVLNEYELKYYDRNTIHIEKDLQDLGKFQEFVFFERNFFNCVNLYVLEQKRKIEALKTEKAKLNRQEKLTIKIDELLSYLVDYYEYEKDSDFYKKIENLK